VCYAPAVAAEQRIAFDSGRGAVLAGVVHRPEDWRAGGPAAVVCHGMLSSKDSPKHTGMARRLAARGLMALRFDFAGRGESGGTLRDLTCSGEVGDLAAAVGLVRSMGAGSVSLVGSSLGGAVAILYAGGRGEVRGIAVMASVSRPGAVLADSLGPEKMEDWRRAGVLRLEEGYLGWTFQEDASRQDVVAAASRISCPALFVHGSADEVVPPASSHELHAAAAGPKRLVVIDGADHVFSDPAHLERAVALVVDWIV